MKLQEILQKLNAVQIGDNSWKALCPAHNDTNASLSITHKNGRTLLHCMAGCDFRSVLAAGRIEARDLFDAPPSAASSNPSAVPFDYGMKLADYVNHFKFDHSLLASWGLQDGDYTTKKGNRYPAMLVPYKDATGDISAMRLRMRIAKGEKNEPERFLWRKGSKVSLYGIWRLDSASDTVILVEGESDCHALWHIGVNALGIPGVSNYKPARDEAVIEFFDKILIHIEPDEGGLALFTRLVGSERNPPSRLLPKMRFFTLAGYKDPAKAWEMLATRPEEFRRLIGAAIRLAQPADKFQKPPEWAEIEKKRKKQQAGKKPDGRSLASPINGQQGGRPRTDYIGLARAYCDLHRDSQGQLTLRHWRNNWYQFNGQCYQPRLDVDIESAAVAWLQQPHIAEQYNVQPSTNALRNLLLGLRSTTCCGIPAETRAPAWLASGQPADGWIAMQNTVINIEDAAKAHFYTSQNSLQIEDRDLRLYSAPLSPGLLSTFALDYPYDPAAQCPRFLEWLCTTQPDPELQRAVLMLMGLALVPDTSYNVCFFLAGDGGTGKSTFLDILQALIGEKNTCRVPLLKMEDRFSTWPLAESLLNIVGEMPTDDPQGKLRYIEGDFKDSISGGMITIERKGKDICTARCTARHVFATNTLPIFFDKSEGIWDRLIIIPFEQRFRGTTGEVRNIKDTILPGELPGIFNLALFSLAELRQYTRFPEPEACRHVKQFHRDRCDFDAAYLNEHYCLVDNAETPVSIAYSHYRSQLLANGLAPRSSPTFQAAVARVFGIRPAKRSQYDATRVFRGLLHDFTSDLKPTNDMDQPY